MERAIKKLLSDFEFTEDDHDALINSYSSFLASDAIAQINPDRLGACGECLEVDLKFRLKVQEAIKSHLRYEREVSHLYFSNYPIFMNTFAFFINIGIFYCCRTCYKLL